MAFVTAKSGGENPLKELDDGMYEAKIKGFTEVENKFKGQLFNSNKPEGPDNQRNNYEHQFEITLAIDKGDGEELEARVWANPTLGEKSKLRKIVKAANAWIEGPTDEESGFDTDDMEDRKVKILVQDAKIEGWLKA